MAINKPDIFRHNNPNLAFVESDFVRGGIRTKVNDLSDLYDLASKTDEEHAFGQVKERATIVYVNNESSYYELIDVSNIDNEDGWQPFLKDIGDTTELAITGVTNGLTKVGSHEAKLGGDLTESTNITITSGTSFTIIDNRTEYKGLKYGADYSIHYVDRSLVDKGYVDMVAISLRPIEAVITATTGETTLEDEKEVGGVNVYDGDRVLVKDQTDSVENGIYIVRTSNWNRAEDFSGTTFSGSLISVLDGKHGNQLWMLLTPDNPDVGIDPIQFGRFSKPIDILSGEGINITESGGQKTINVDLFDNGALTFENDELSVDENIAGTGLIWNNGVINLDETAVGLTGAINGLTVDGQDVKLGGELTEHTNITITSGTSFTIIDNRTEYEGLKYGADYSIHYVDRSLVDKGYVDTSIGDVDVPITGATNGLSLNNIKEIALGGDLTGNTIINLVDYELIIGEDNNINGGKFNIGEDNLIISYNIDGEDDAKIVLSGDTNNKPIIETTGNIFLKTEPNSGNTENIKVLVRDTTNNEIKEIPQDSLGEDNNEYSIRIVTGNTTLDETDHVILARSDFEDFIITLPLTPINGQTYKIKDCDGNALTNNITINGNGRDVDDDTTAVLNTDYGALEVIFSDDLGKWYVLSFVN